MHSLFGFPEFEFWATFCFPVFPVELRPRIWLVGCLRPQHCSVHSAWIDNWPSSTFLFVKMHLSVNSCWPLYCTGSCSTQEFKVPKKELADMLRWLIQFLCLFSAGSQFGDALTCYSCGPHSDQVMPLTFQRVASNFFRLPDNTSSFCCLSLHNCNQLDWYYWRPLVVVSPSLPISPYRRQGIMQMLASQLVVIPDSQLYN